MKFIVILLIASVSAVLDAHGARVRLKSPDGKCEILLDVSEKNITYATFVNGKAVITPSAIQLNFTEKNWFKAPFVIKGKLRTLVNQQYSLPSGKASEHINHYSSLKVSIENGEREMACIELRAYNDGVAFRFLLQRSGPMTISSESTDFRLISGTTIFIQKWDKAGEGFYDERRPDTLNRSEAFLMPALAKLPEGMFCLIGESAVNDYPGTEFKSLGTGSYGFTTHLPDKSYTSIDSLVTPWRFFILGNLKTIVASNLAENLNPPTQIENTDWIKPGVAVFPWWADHLASSDQDVLRKYVDMAAEMKWEWIEFDVALVGTDLHTSTLWKSTDWLADFVGYAHSKNILVYGWDEYKALNTPEKREDLFSRYRKLGIDGIKIDFLDSDKSEMMAFRRDVLNDAAKWKLMVSLHGEATPRGQRRTWPHLLAQEAVRGEEYYTFPGYPAPTPEHNVTLPFTRNVIGPMDYTPSTFSSTNRLTSAAHELALPFVYECGWMVMADKPEAYLSSPAKDILQELSSTWDETILIDGRPGSYAVVARRKHNRWFVAGINAGEQRKLELDLTDLGVKNRMVTIYNDSKTSLIAKNADQIKNSRLMVTMEKNGGFVFALDIN